MKTLKKLLTAAFILLSSSAFADEKSEASLSGYCPVCYVAVGKAVKGTPEFKAEHDGKTYYFVKQDALDAFEKTPEKFIPAYGGYCALGMAYGKKVEADPTVFTVVDGKIYLNKNAAIGKKFEKDPASYIAKADAAWKKMEMAKEKK